MYRESDPACSVLSCLCCWDMRCLQPFRWKVGNSSGLPLSAHGRIIELRHMQASLGIASAPRNFPQSRFGGSRLMADLTRVTEQVGEHLQSLCCCGFQGHEISAFFTGFDTASHSCGHNWYHYVRKNIALRSVICSGVPAWLCL